MPIQMLGQGSQQPSTERLGTAHASRRSPTGRHGSLAEILSSTLINQRSSFPPHFPARRDNKGLSIDMKAAKGTSWGQLQWQDFELLCYEYLCCCYPDTEIVRTPPTQDGGKDVVINVRHPALSSRIWVECKMHSRPIGLEVLGKNVVIIVNERVDRLIILSANAVTKPAKMQLMQFAARNNFKLTVLEEDGLEREVSRFPQLISRFLPGLAPAPAASPNDIEVSCIASEFENDASVEQPRLKLRRDTRFYVHVLLKNSSNVRQELALSFDDSPHISISPGRRTATLTLDPLEDRLHSFYCELLPGAMTVEVPALRMTARSENGSELCTRHEVGEVDVTFMRRAPLIGEQVVRFVTGELPDLMDDVQEGRARVVDLRGGSGVGKSRVLQEAAALLRRRGADTYEFDARESDDFRVFRRLLGDLLGLPLHRGFARYSAEQLADLFENSGFGRESGEAVHRFLVHGQTSAETIAVVSEAIKFFLLRRAGTVPVGLLIDNVQEMSPATVPVWEDLIAFLRSTRISVCMIFSTNVETFARERSQVLSRFLDRLEDARNVKEPYIAGLRVPEFTEGEAALFIRNMLPDVNEHDQLVGALVQHAGTRPLYLEIFLDYMEDSGALRFTAGGTWYVSSVAALAGFLRSVPPGVSQALDRRVEALRAHSGGTLWESIRKALAAILAFEGKLPIEFLGAVALDHEIADFLTRRGLTRYDRHDDSLHVYHDVLKRYFAGSPAFRLDRGLAAAVADWIESHPEAEVENGDKIQFDMYMRLNRRGAALNAGSRALRRAHDAQNHPQVVAVGDVLLGMMEARLDAAKVPEFLDLATMHADSLIHDVDSARGLAAYERLREHLRNAPSSIPSEFRHRYYHEAVNSCILHLRFPAALELLREHEAMEPHDLRYDFLIQNRYAVIYTALDDLPHALEHIERAMALAEQGGDPYLISTVASDHGYIHFYLTLDASEASRWYTRAVAVHGAVPNPPPWRQVEAAQQAGFVRFLASDWEGAVGHAEQALHICRRSKYTLLKLRVANLRASCLLHLDRFDAAEDALHEARSEAELFGNERERWRVVSNLAVLYHASGEPHRARDFAEIGWEAFVRSAVPRDAVVKELPLLANTLLFRYMDGNEAGAREVVRAYPHPRLSRYLTALRATAVSRRPLRGTDVAPIGLASFRGFGLFIS
ncbi:MAG TPA: AAA family ATPase [Longimicrobium sp.]